MTDVAISVELQGIDLSGVEEARQKIAALLQDETIKKLLAGGGIEAALGSLGEAIEAVKGSGDASSLMGPLVEAAESLLAHVDPSAIPIGDYLSAVKEGADIVINFVAALHLDPAAIGKILPIDSLKKSVETMTAGYSTTSSDFGSFQSLVARVEAGVPTNPQELAKLAVDVLLPFGGSGLLSVRASLDAFLSASASISLPSGRFAGLLLALARVEASAGDSLKLDAALANLQAIRTATLDVLTDDIGNIRAAIERLDIANKLAPIVTAAAAIKAGEHGPLEMLDELRGFLEHALVEIEGFDMEQARAYIERIIAMLDGQLRQAIEGPVDQSIAAGEQFVRSLFAHLPLRAFRAQVSDFLAGIAMKIEDAHLDAAADKVHELLAKLDEAVDPAKLTGELQGLIARIKTAIEGVINTLNTQLKAIVDEIKAVEEKLKAVFERVVAVLHDFSEAMASLQATIDNLPIEDAANEVIAGIHALREQAESLLSNAELPEPLKPLVQEGIKALEGIDLQGLFGPVDDVVAQIKIPAEIGGQITSVLHDIQSKLENAVPAQLIESITGDVGKVLEIIRGFNPATLLDGVGKYIEDAAKLVESLDPTKAADAISGPFQKVLDAFDAIHPRTLLKPIIDAYASVMGAGFPKPTSDSAVASFATVMNDAGSGMAQQVLAPAAKATGATVDVPKDGTTPPTATPEPQLQTKVKPGDVVRLFGFLPNKLREALHGLSEGTAGEALRAIDSVTAGLARDLRLVRAKLLDVTARIEAQLDVALAPVGDAQFSAQAAIHVSPAPGIDIDASVNVIATVSPGALRGSIEALLDQLRTAGDDAAHLAGGDVATALDQAARALESFRLAGAVGSLDDLLAILDPEPIAAQMDALAAAALKKAPDILAQIDDTLLTALQRLRQLFDELNPATQAQKLMRILDVLRQEMEVLDPGRLADELGAIHRILRDAIAAYDPRLVAKDLQATVKKIADGLRALKPAELFGDLTFLGPLVDTLEEVDPAKVLGDVGAGLKDVGAELAKLDPAGILDAVNGLPKHIEDAFKKAVEQIRTELVALLKSLKYAAGNASVSVEGSVTT